MEKIATAAACTLAAFICMACLYLAFDGDGSLVLVLVGLYGTFIFGVLSLALWLCMAVNYFLNKEKQKNVSIYTVFAAVDIVTALCIGIYVIVNDTGFMAGLLTMAYFIYILPVFVGLLAADLCLWKAARPIKWVKAILAAIITFIITTFIMMVVSYYVVVAFFD